MKAVLLNNLSDHFIANTVTKEILVDPTEVVQPNLKTLNGNEVYGSGNLNIIDLGGDPVGTAINTIVDHNSNPNAHNDIRISLATKMDEGEAYQTFATQQFVEDDLAEQKIWTESNFVSQEYYEVSSIPTYVGESTTPATNIKRWVGYVTTNVDGLATVSFPQMNFTQLLDISCQAISPETGTAAGNAAWCSIFRGTITNSSFDIRTKSANSAGLLAAMVAVNVATDVYIEVLGVSSTP